MWIFLTIVNTCCNVICAYRSIRFAKELRPPSGQSIEIVANDIDQNAVNLVEANAMRNLPGFRPTRTCITLPPPQTSFSMPSPSHFNVVPSAATPDESQSQRRRRSLSANALTGPGIGTGTDTSEAPTPTPDAEPTEAELASDAPLYLNESNDNAGSPASGSGVAYHPILTSCADAAQCMYMCKNLRPTSKFQVLDKI